MGVANFSWRFLPDLRTFWENPVYLIRETFHNRNRDGSILDRGEYDELALRSDLSFQAGRELEAGMLIRLVESSILDRRYNFSRREFLDFDSVRARYRQDAFYAQDRWRIGNSGLSAILGARFERLELTGQTVANPRVSLEWKFGEKQKIDAGWGIFSQFPEALPVLGRNGDARLRAETARQHVLGYETLLGDKSRLRFEVYAREESNLHRRPDSLFRLAGGKVLPPSVDFRYDNALRGHSRGVEIFVQRRSANRLAGWVSYAWEDSRREDLATGEKYSGDYEQKHTVNIYGSYRFTETWNLSLKARFGCGFPYPGYFEKLGAEYFLSSERNRERLPHYNRIDLRLNKAFFYARSKLSLYVEVLNILNRENLRYEQAFGVNSSTRLIRFANDSLMPILPTAGFVLEF